MSYFSKVLTGTLAAAALYFSADVAVEEHNDTVALRNKVTELMNSGTLLAAAADKGGRPVELGGRMHSALDSTSPTVILKLGDGSLIVQMFAEDGSLLVSRQMHVDKYGHIMPAIIERRPQFRPCYKDVPCGEVPG